MTNTDSKRAARSAALQKYGTEKISVVSGKHYFANKLGQVRPENTFANFELYSEEQRPIVARLQAIAQQLVTKPEILTDEFPFANGRILFLTSAPGFGKTHLAEAIINHVAENKPEVLAKMVLSRGTFTSDHFTSANEYSGAPIVIIDDIFANVQSIQAMTPGDLISLMNFITMLYERRVFAVITSNFRLLGDDGGILGRVAAVDKVQRVLSRFKQVLANSGEIVLPGKDFREELAKRQSGGEFIL